MPQGPQQDPFVQPVFDPLGACLGAPGGMTPATALHELTVQLGRKAGFVTFPPAEALESDGYEHDPGITAPLSLSFLI